MALKRITDYTLHSTPLAGTEQFEVDDAGAPFRTTAIDIAKTAVQDAINNGTTDRPPSQNAVFDALALKAPLAAPTFTGNHTVSQADFVTGDISPAQLVANTNDWAPTGFSTCAVIRVDTDASRDITGIAAGADGREITLLNIGAFNAVLKDESASSAAANRFALSGDITLAPDTGVILWYDATSSRWRAKASPGSAASGDVVGPASATDMALAAFDTGTGKLIQERAITVSDVAGNSVTLATTPGNALSVEATAPTATVGASQAGKAAALTASDAVASTDTAGAAAGGDVTIEGGAAARLTSGNADGGNVVLKGGAGIGTGVTGQVLLDSDGTVARPALAFDIGGNKAYGLWYAGGVISLSINGVSMFGVNNAGIIMPAGGGVVGNATTPGVMYGFKRQRFDLTTSTTLSSGSYNGSTLTNLGAGAGITSTLVSAAAGWHHRLIDDNAGGFRWTIKPNTADTIIWTDGTVVTAATGSIVSTARYDAFDVEALDTGVWLARNVRGTWTVTP